MTKQTASSRYRPTVMMVDESPNRPRRVFPAAPSVDCYFASESAERARTSLVRCIERTDGPALLIGPSGSGKSLMLAALADAFQHRLSVASLTGGLLRTPRELHQGILYALGMSFRGMDEGELRLSLQQRLEEDDASEEGVLLLVDEAASLSLELLEELRMLTNVVHKGVSRVQVVLAGTPDLEEQLAEVRLASFQQRIAVRCYLTEMSRSETKAYVQAHLSAADRPPELFESDALDQVFELTEGMPRLVNQLCDHALLLAQAEGREPIDAALVDEAWSDLQQLPSIASAASEDADGAAPEDVLEFGELGELEKDDDPATQLDAIEEQLASISLEAARVAENAAPHSTGEEEIDFSLPENEWPEVEVVLRQPPAAAASDFQEEEVIADPFREAPSIQTSVWDPTKGVSAKGGVGSGAMTLGEAYAEVPPIESVPLMVHVETDLYAPDPVWPEEQIGGASIVATDHVPHAPILGPSDGWDAASGESPARPVDAPAPSVPESVVVKRSLQRPAQKRFANLFSSLAD